MAAYLVFIIHVLELHPSVWFAEIDTFQFINRAMLAQASGSRTCSDEYTRWNKADDNDVDDDGFRKKRMAEIVGNNAMAKCESIAIMSCVDKLTGFVHEQCIIRVRWSFRCTKNKWAWHKDKKKLEQKCQRLKTTTRCIGLNASEDRCQWIWMEGTMAGKY